MVCCGDDDDDDDDAENVDVDDDIDCNEDLLPRFEWCLERNYESL